MEINIKDLEKIVSADIEANNSTPFNNQTSTTDNPYKVFYPFNDGQYELRLFFNFKANKVQRLIVRHGNEPKAPKLPCLSMYNMPCPACKVIKDIESVQGDNSEIQRKYGYKKKGICYAQIIDAPSKTFQGDFAPKKGDIVLLMYPKTVFDAINNIVLSAIRSGKINDIVNSNVAYHITLNKDSSKGPNAYQVLQTFNQSQLFKTDDEFEKFICELPNLDEQLVIETPDDGKMAEIHNSVKAFAELLASTYLNNSIVNPNQAVVEENKGVTATAKLDSIIDDTPTTNIPTSTDVSDLKEIIIDDEDLPFEINDNNTNNNAENNSSTSETSNDGKPECFGKYNKNSSTCWLCPNDIECQKANA